MNRLCGYISNLPTGVASCATFKRYHNMHHALQGDDLDDLDLPSMLEIAVFRGKVGKLLFVSMQVFFYALRPSILRPLAITLPEVLGWAIQLSFDYAVAVYLGPKAIMYMLLGNLFGLGLHPMAGHFIAEHYLFLPGETRGTKTEGSVVTGQETFSYYGPLNYLAYNVGYHNEHHDFPRIPGRLLPKVKEIAPEWYQMPHHTSWCRVLWDFVMCDHISLASRVKRRGKNGKYD